MRNVIVSMFVSLDGIMDEPAWTAPYWNDDIAAFKLSELMDAEALLLGRKTYEGFVEAWPGRTDEQGFADKMNAMPKYVASNTLETPQWNATFLKGDIANEVAKLKQGEGGPLLVAGSGMLVQTLVKHNLVDTYRLLVYPVVLGKGIRLFEPGTKTTVKLVDSKPLQGVISMIYEPAETNTRVFSEDHYPLNPDGDSA